MSSLSLRHMDKIYPGNVKAVSDFNLEIEDKEFIVFVGPSGCGKSTTLRMVAGLEDITAGELYIDGRLVNDVEPKDRDIAMVFQNYALYPHMTVYENMAFGLKLRKIPKDQIDQRVKEAAGILHIEQLLSRKPKALSGGQRQRVALGRALVRYPKVFLLDEPLSNLDAKLRVAMRTEITKLHNKLGTTFIYVTHDQVEAMTMGTRIVVMKDGLAQQVDTPQNLYDNPVNLFVATFIGTPQMNIINAMLSVDSDGKMYCEFGDNKITIPKSRANRLVSDQYIGKEILVGVRPEDLHEEELFLANNKDTVIEASVDVIEKLGNETILYLKIDGKTDYAIARVSARSNVEQGEKIHLAIDAKHIHFFDKDTENSIMGVPKVDIIENAMLEANQDDDGISGVDVKFGKTTCPIDNSILNRLVDASVINDRVHFGIPPENLYLKQDLEAKEVDLKDYIKIDTTVAFSEKYPQFTALYCPVEGKKGFVVAKTGLDCELRSDNPVELYFRPQDIMLFNSLTGDKVLSKKPAVSNKISCTVVALNGEMNKISFGSNSLTVPKSVNVSDTVYIDPTAVVFAKPKEKLDAQYAKTSITGVVTDLDVLGSKTVVYFNVAGCEGEFAAITEGTPNYIKGEKVKFGIKLSGISNQPSKNMSMLVIKKVGEEAIKASEEITNNETTNN